jgi:serine/threonine-protein kinase
MDSVRSTPEPVPQGDPAQAGGGDPKDVDTPPPGLGRTRQSPQRLESPHVLDEDWEIARNQGIGPLSHAGLITEGPDSFVLGDFKVIRKIGIGGFGAVYLARQLSMNRDVALKVLARSKAVRPDFVERFLREARTLIRLIHPNIVRGYVSGEEQGWHYFAMEYVDGESLFSWLRRLGRLPVAESLHLTLRVADALSYAHQLNLVHRDIKPENILLTTDGRVKLADLGLAKEMDEDLSLTRTGTGFGTPYYMAPEQARNAKYVDHRSDIYALGTTLYHCLTGKLPFKGDTALELILAKEKDPYTPVRRHNRDIPERVDLIVAKMLAKKPHERYQSCADLIADIERLELSSSELPFIKSSSTPEPGTFDSGIIELQTREVDVAVRQAAATLPQRPDDHWWYVRHRTSKGEMSTQLLTTKQLQNAIQDVNFDLNALVCDEPDGEFRSLMHYPEFQSSFRRRQSQSVRSNAERRNSGLRRVYSQVENQMAEEERRRQAEEAQKERPLAEDVRELAKHKVVKEGVDSLKRWWESDTVGKVKDLAAERVSQVRQMTKEEEGRRTLIKYGVIAGGVIAAVIFLKFLLDFIFYITGR